MEKQVFFNVGTSALTLLALIGVVLNIKKRIECFYIWLFTNASWAIIDFYKDVPAQGVLFTIYTVLALYGILEWRKRDDDKSRSGVQN